MKKQLIDKEKAGAAVMAGFNKSDCLHRLNLVKNEDAILREDFLNETKAFLEAALFMILAEMEEIDMLQTGKMQYETGFKDAKTACKAIVEKMLQGSQQRNSLLDRIVYDELLSQKKIASFEYVLHVLEQIKITAQNNPKAFSYGIPAEKCIPISSINNIVDVYANVFKKDSDRNG